MGLATVEEALMYAYETPTPVLGQQEPDAPLVPSGSVQEEVVEPLVGGSGGPVNSGVWYRSPWLWGGVAVLGAAAVTAVWWSRRTGR